MKRYVEPSPTARQLFFLAAVAWLGLIVLATHFTIDISLGASPSDVLADLQRRNWYLLPFLVLFYGGLSALAIYLAIRAVRTKQWPPAGLAVPFRTQVRTIHRPYKVWLCLAVLLAIYVTHVVLAGVQARAVYRMVEETLLLVAPLK